MSACVRGAQRSSPSVYDRWHNDHERFGCWTDEVAYFVIRLTHNAGYRVKNLPVPAASNSNAPKDQVVRFRGRQASKQLSHVLRTVCVYDQEQKRAFQFLANNVPDGGEGPGVDRADHDVDAALNATEVALGLVDVESGGNCCA